jgi:hypothetical protein
MVEMRVTDSRWVAEPRDLKDAEISGGSVNCRPHERTGPTLIGSWTGVQAGA